MPDGKRSAETDETVPAPISGKEATIAASASAADATQLTATPSMPTPSAPRSQGAGTPASRASVRKVGAEIASASIDRFGSVSRDRFEVLDELARGGLGRVFRARDPRTGRIIAIKEVLHPAPDIVARFAREATVTANLQHPSIVPVYEVGTWGNGEPFYAMKLVAGRTLDRVIAEASTTDARVALAPHVIAVADALAYAHSERVIHRDLKPSNVIVGSYGETVVIDWGLAKNLVIDEGDDSLGASPAVAADSQETVAGSVLGTPAYMPPEQARGERLDESADVYAIGAMLYHVLTGKRPFADVTTMAELIEAVASRPPVSILELAPDAPAELVAIAEKAMARDAKARYPTAEGLAADLRRFQTGKLVGAHHYSRLQLVRRWIARNAAAVAVATAAFLVLAVSGVIAVRRIASERDEARRQGAIARERQADAESANAQAKRRLADTLEELARQALLNEQPERALPLLAASVATRGEPTATAGVLSAQARAAYTGLVAIAPGPASPATSGALAAGGLILVADKDGHVTAWHMAERRTRWTVDAGPMIAVSPDGTRFLASATDGTVTLRSVDDGRTLDTWPAKAGAHPTNLAWAPGGARFAFAGDNGHLGIGSPGDPVLVDAVVAAGEMYGVTFSPDGTRIASGGTGGVVTVTDARTGATVASLGAPPREVTAVSWVDTDRLVEGDDQGATRMWHVGQRRILRRFDLGRAIYAFTLALDGSWLAVAGDGEIVKVWNVATGELRADLTGHGLGVDLVATAGDWLVTGDELGAVRVWDPRSGERLHTFPSEAELVSLEVRDGLVAGIARSRSRVWKLEPNAVVRRIEAHTARIRGLHFGPDGKIYAASVDGTGSVLDPATGAVVRLGTPEGVVEAPSRTIAEAAKNAKVNPHGARSITLSPDGRTIALALEDGRIALFDKTGKALATWRGHTGRVRRVIFTSDGKTAYSVGDNTLRRWDVATGSEQAKVPLASSGWDVALLNASTIATLSDDPPIVQLWRTSDLVEVKHSPPLQSTLPELAVVRDRLLVTDRATLTLVDATGTELHSFPHSVPFSVDSNSAGGLAVGSSNGVIMLYDLDTLAPIRDLPVGSHVIARLAFRPDGKLLAAVSENRLQLLDPTSGRLLAQLPDLPVVLSQLTWSPDGRYLAVAGAGGTVWVWDIAPKDARELDAFGTCVSPWRLEDTTLVKKPFVPESCAILAP